MAKYIMLRSGQKKKRTKKVKKQKKKKKKKKQKSVKKKKKKMKAVNSVQYQCSSEFIISIQVHQCQVLYLQSFSAQVILQYYIQVYTVCTIPVQY